MTDYRKSLHTVGTVLLALGMLDIAWDVTAVVLSPRNYSFGPAPLALIPAGILLRRGSLRTARFVSLVAALVLSGYLGYLLGCVFVMRVPLDLGVAYLRLRPLTAVEVIFWAIVPPVIVLWIIRRLTTLPTQPPTDGVAVGHRRRWHWPAAGFAVGAISIMVLATAERPVIDDLRPVAERARVEARTRAGGDYKLFVASCSRSYEPNGTRTGRGTVIAYNRHEIRNVKVTWKE